MSLLSKRSRELHAAWKALETADGAEGARRAVLEELNSTRAGRRAQWFHNAGKKGYLRAASTPSAVLSGGALGQFMSYDSLYEFINATPLDLTALSLASGVAVMVGIVTLSISPIRASSEVARYNYYLSSVDRHRAQAKESYLQSVSDDLTTHSYTILSSDESTGSFLTHRGVVVVAEDDAGSPLLLLDGKPLTGGYEGISSSTSSVVGLNGSRLAITV